MDSKGEILMNFYFVCNLVCKSFKLCKKKSYIFVEQKKHLAKLLKADKKSI